MTEMKTRLRLGMIGGGQGAFIGAVHRIASRIDDEYELVAGCFSSSPERGAASAAELGVAPRRSYASFEDMANAEAAREDGIDAVAIVTPNHLHFPAAKPFLERGIHVICDKPLTAQLAEAKEYLSAVENSASIFALTHNYSGYPLIRQARAMVASGELGAIRVVQAEYPQDWLAKDIESGGQKQASWRTDPAKSGAGGCIGDIGTHAYQLARFVTGLKLERLRADLQAFVPGRRVDDNAHVTLQFEGGARGMLWSSQVAVGNENGLRLRVYGEKAGIEWSQENPNQMWFTRFGEPKQLLTRGGAGINLASERVTRIPAGHPEGYLEGFATIYSEVAQAIRAAKAGVAVPEDVLFPGIEDGIEGVAFVDACVRSSADDGAWVKLDL